MGNLFGQPARPRAGARSFAMPSGRPRAGALSREPTQVLVLGSADVASYNRMQDPNALGVFGGGTSGSREDIQLVRGGLPNVMNRQQRYGGGGTPRLLGGRRNLLENPPTAEIVVQPKARAQRARGGQVQYVPSGEDLYAEMYAVPAAEQAVMAYNFSQPSASIDSLLTANPEFLGQPRSYLSATPSARSRKSASKRSRKSSSNLTAGRKAIKKGGVAELRKKFES